MNQFPFDPQAASNAESCPDLLRCMYNLSDMDMEALRLLLDEGPFKAEDLADRLGRDRSTVYRSLQKLVSCQVISKETRSLKRGGYYHVYAAVPREVLRERLEHCIEQWHSRVSMLLDRFDEDMDSF
ncbi:MAG: HTH domain-containing protein [Thermoplasmata archaeon]|nr:MAG: HTH domain-containing protein [Thermoplasmata archaeon]